MNKRVLLIVIGSVSVVAVVGGLLLWRQYRPLNGTDAKPQGGVIPKLAAPGFTLAGNDGSNVSLNDLRGNYVILFFSGGLNCFTCLPQIGNLNTDPALNNGDTLAFSVVPDSPATWQKAEEASTSLAQARPLFDTSGEVFQEYRDLNISSLMRQGLHMAHTYFVINKVGTIVSVFDDSAMGTRNDVLISLLDKIRQIESNTP